MSNQVELRVKSQIEDIIADFEKLNGKVREVQSTLDGAAKNTTDELQNNAKKTEVFFGKLKSLSSRVSDQIKSDFKSLLAINAAQQALNLSNQFKGSISESVKLGDTIRKLGGTFGVASKDFAKFQAGMVKGLGEIGLSSAVASNTLEALADTPVRGQRSLQSYAKTSGMLASLSNQQGKEGDIAKGIAEVINARGGDVNDEKQVGAVAEDLRRAFNVTGKAPTEMLGAMKQLFTTMPAEFRKQISTRGLVNMAAAGQVAGPNSTKFLQELLSKGSIARTAFESQGFKGVFNDDGIDMERFGKASKGILGRVKSDPRFAAQTLGLSEEAAEGFVRLAESMEQVTEAQRKIAASTGSVNDQYRDSMSLGESFRANINRIKGYLAEPLAVLQNKATDLFTKASESDAGAAGVVAGGGLLAAILAGIGLKGIGKGLGIGGRLKAEAEEQITGEKIQKVYVVNAAEIGASGGIADMLGKGGGAGMKGMLIKGAAVAGVGLAGAAGYGLGTVANDQLVERTQGKTAEGFEGNIVERLFFKLDQLIGGDASKSFNQNTKAMNNPERILKLKVEVEKGLKKTTPNRGSNF